VGESVVRKMQFPWTYADFARPRRVIDAARVLMSDLMRRFVLQFMVPVLDNVALLPVVY